MVEDGTTGPARKRTGFLSSSWAVIEELEGACNGAHDHHHHLIDGRAKGAEVYPPRTLSSDMQEHSKAENG